VGVQPFNPSVYLNVYAIFLSMWLLFFNVMVRSSAPLVAVGMMSFLISCMQLIGLISFQNTPLRFSG
jgi:hypothetical protein